MPEMGDQTEFVGDIDELDQTDDLPVASPFGYAFSVNVDGPVQIHHVPSTSAGSRSWNGVSATEAQRVANADPRRRSCTVIALDQNIYVGADRNQAESGYGALWPKNVPLVLTHQDEVYVRSATATTAVSVIVENWAS